MAKVKAGLELVHSKVSKYLIAVRAYYVSAKTCFNVNFVPLQGIACAL
jgi:hypothetical protein